MRLRQCFVPTELQLPTRVILVSNTSRFQPVTAFSKLQQWLLVVHPFQILERGRTILFPVESLQQPRGMSHKPRHALMRDPDDRFKSFLNIEA